ncbi:MAG: hypothetical protein AAGC46_14460 [Solirubrobacteraceae bacterium]|nr:hypothetical protein [Patulibacter sp.]
MSSRRPERRAAIEAVGAEFLVADPDRIVTLRYACEHVTILVWALGTAVGEDPDQLAALHDTRLSMMLERTIDTTVRGVVYEGRGTLPPEVFETGRAVVERMCRKNEIPFAVLDADPAETEAWADEAHTAITALLARDRG